MIGKTHSLLLFLALYLGVQGSVVHVEEESRFQSFVLDLKEMRDVIDAQNKIIQNQNDVIEEQRRVLDELNTTMDGRVTAVESDVTILKRGKINH